MIKEQGWRRWVVRVKEWYWGERVEVDLREIKWVRRLERVWGLRVAKRREGGGM